MTRKKFSAKIVGKVLLEEQTYKSTELMSILKPTLITAGMAVMQNIMTQATETVTRKRNTESFFKTQKNIYKTLIDY